MRYLLPEGVGGGDSFPHNSSMTMHTGVDFGPRATHGSTDLAIYKVPLVSLVYILTNSISVCILMTTD